MEKTWEPKRQGEQLRGVWRKHRRNPDSTMDIYTPQPFLETDDGDALSLPSDPRVDAMLQALDPDDGDRLIFSYDGLDRDGDPVYHLASEG